ncbi:MAG: OmpA family protein [Bacteroidales bacterium]|nr:OmpA family protein [Bacteroidales bacterium]
MKTLLFFSFLFVSIMLLSQQNADVNVIYKKILNIYKNGDYEVAVNKALYLFSIDSEYEKLYPLIVDLYFKLNKPDSAMIFYKKYEGLKSKSPEIIYTLGNIMYREGYLLEAINNYIQCKSHAKVDSILKEKALKNYYRCLNAKRYMENAQKIELINLGEGINSCYDEYYPMISVDEKYIIFTRRVPKWGGVSASSSNTQEDFYISYFEGDKWSNAKPLPGKINTIKNEGASAITADGNYIVFTACDRIEGKGSCDLYYSVKKGDLWSEAFNIKEINTPFWESQPSLSPDGKYLFFASNRLGGYGESDIYMSVRQENGMWSKPILLDSTINTKYAEISPFIHPNGKVLYFSSKGHNSIGGFDIFMSQRIGEFSFSKPVNLGFPINTTKDDIGFIVSSSGNKAFIVSSRTGGYGLNDIYYFILPDSLKTTKTVFFKISVYDSETNKAIEVRCKVINLEKNIVVYDKLTSSNENDYVYIGLPVNEHYGLYIVKEGYMFYSEHFYVSEKDTIPAVKKIYLSKITKGKSFTLPNIFFDTDSFNLKPLSYTELIQLSEYLKNNTNVSIEICGHTDNSGSDEYNKKLSEKRAYSVYSFLIQQGINKNRMTYKGYGSSKPIASNETSDGRSLNRRTEIVIH